MPAFARNLDFLHRLYIPVLRREVNEEDKPTFRGFLKSELWWYAMPKS